MFFFGFGLCKRDFVTVFFKNKFTSSQFSPLGFNFTLFRYSAIGGFPPDKAKISEEFSLDTAVVMRDMRHLVNRLKQKLGNHTIQYIRSPLIEDL